MGFGILVSAQKMQQRESELLKGKCFFQLHFFLFLSAYRVSGQPAASGNTVRRQISPVVPGSFLSAPSFNKLRYLSGAVQQANGRMLGRVNKKKK